MITPIVRLAQALAESKTAHAEIEAEEVLGDINRFHRHKALQYSALAEQYAALSVKELQMITVNRTVSPIIRRKEAS